MGKKGYELDPAMTTGPDFLAYDATQGTGFRRFTSYANLAVATEKDVVELDAGSMPAGSHTVRAAKINGNVEGSGRFRITSGGLILRGDLGADVDFGAAEGVIYASDLGPNKRATSFMFMNLKGKISGANGVTCLGGPLPFGMDWAVPGAWASGSATPRMISKAL